MGSLTPALTVLTLLELLARHDILQSNKTVVGLLEFLPTETGEFALLQVGGHEMKVGIQWRIKCARE
jgi:hypothetical protein